VLGDLKEALLCSYGEWCFALLVPPVWVEIFLAQELFRYFYVIVEDDPVEGQVTESIGDVGVKRLPARGCRWLGGPRVSV